MKRKGPFKNDCALGNSARRTVAGGLGLLLPLPESGRKIGLGISVRDGALFFADDVYQIYNFDAPSDSSRMSFGSVPLFRWLDLLPAVRQYEQVRINPQEWNPQFLDFANYYGIIPKTCRIRRARTIGKVERSVYYVKDNFLNGRSFADDEDLNLQGLAWLNNTANVRIRGTTGCKPIDLFAQEKLTAYKSIVPYRYR